MESRRYRKRIGNDIQVEKKLLGKHLGIPVYLVDGSKLRKSVTWEMVKNPAIEYFDDFLDYGISNDFPQIPEGEIWIADELHPEERIVVIRVAARRLRLLDSGESEHDAYVKSEKLSHHLRRSAFPHCKRNPRIRIYKEIEDVKIWVVSGFDVRCQWLTRFIQGGHHYVYPFIPKNEVWLDDTLDADEFEPVFIHEFVEMKQMRDNGLAYDPAHNIAEGFEYEYREKMKEE